MPSVISPAGLEPATRGLGIQKVVCANLGHRSYRVQLSGAGTPDARRCPQASVHNGFKTGVRSCAPSAVAQFGGHVQVDALLGQVLARSVISVRTGAQPVAFELSVMADLQVQPEPLGRAELAREPKGAVGAGTALPTDALIDATRQNPDRNCPTTLADTRRLQLILDEDASRVNRLAIRRRGHCPSALVSVDPLLSILSLRRPRRADGPIPLAQMIC